MASHKYFKVLLCMSLVLFIPCICMATITGTIKGKVQNESGEPLVEAAIKFTSTSLISPVIALTDENGEYVIAGLPPGRYTLQVRFMGYKDVEKTDIRLGIDENLTINFVLTIEVIEGTGLIIESEPGAVDREKTKTDDKITEDDIESIANADPGIDYQSVIERLPGVLNGHIRGGGEDEIAYKVDGATIIDPVSGTFGTNINSNAIEEIEVSTGGFQAEYGDNMSGVVNIVTKSGGDEFHGTLEMTVINNRMFGRDERNSQYWPQMYFEGPIKKNKAWFTISGRIINSDYQYRPDERAKPYMQDDNYYWRGYDITAKTTWQLSANDKLTGELIVSDAEFDGGAFEMPQDTHTMTDQTAYFFIMREDHLFSVTSFLETTFSFGKTDLFFHLPDNDGDGDYLDEYQDLFMNAYLYTAEQRNGFQIEYIDGTENFYSDQKREAYTLNVDYTLRVSDKHRFRIGGDAQMNKWFGNRLFVTDDYYWFPDAGYGVYDPNDPTQWYWWYDYTDLDPNDVLNDDNGDGIISDSERENADFDFYGFNASLYFQDHWNVLEVLTLDAGIRMDYEKETAAYDVAPRLGVSYSPNSRTAIRANYGLFYNQPFLWWTHFGEFPIGEYDAYVLGDRTDRVSSLRFSQMNNKNLKSEKTQMWEFSVERDLDGNKVARWLKIPWAVENTQATLTYWHKEMTDLLEAFEYSKFDDNDANGTFARPDSNHDNFIVANTGDGQGDGIELRLRRRLSRNFEFLLAYTWMKVDGRLQSYDTETKDYITETVPLDWDQRHTVRVTGVYYWPYRIKDFKMTFQWRYDSGEPYTQRYFDDEGQVQNGPTNSERYPESHSLDLRFIKAFKFSERMKLDAFVNVVNVYSRENIWYIDRFTGNPIFTDFRAHFFVGASLHF